MALQVNDAVALLTNYNARLSKEMEQRKHVAGMLRDFLQAQLDLKEQAEQRLAVSVLIFMNFMHVLHALS